MSDVRLIERWLPIGALSEESVRERRSMTALPPINYLHVWWARRPLVASRAAIMASLLPATADHDMFMQVLGIHGDPVASRKRIDIAKKAKQRFEGQAYSYDRAFSYSPSVTEIEWVKEQTGRTQLTLLDPTAGGGSIPFESRRLGMTTFANDLNPVAASILSASIDLPAQHGLALVDEYEAISSEFAARREAQIRRFYPEEPDTNCIPTNYIWARTVACPYCAGKVPLAPNWKLNPEGVGVQLVPILDAGAGSANRVCKSKIVHSDTEHSPSTITSGDATCPYPDCGRIIDGDEVKLQAKNGDMGEQLIAIVYKKPVDRKTKSGKTRVVWERGYRSPEVTDDNEAEIRAFIEDHMPEWEILDVIPREDIDEISNYDRGHRMYGMTKWTDFFNPRQLLGHCISVKIFQEMFDEANIEGDIAEIRKAAFVYLAFSLDKLRDYNSRQTRWITQREATANTFDSHNFAMRWTYTEMAIMIEGVGYDWAFKQTSKCIRELVELIQPGNSRDGPLFNNGEDRYSMPPSVITCGSGDNLVHIPDGSVDAVIMDPPYGHNVMYAELSDFFYVWLKRTAGRVIPGLFTRYLTDKTSEAVANKARFKESKGSDQLANRDYQGKMAAIFAESRRVLKADGIMTVMFTHKDTSAWDALTKGLIEAGFIITASWPVNTEAEGSLHIKDKAAANSTIFLVCRPRVLNDDQEVTYWEDVEPMVANAVRTRVNEFQKAGIVGVDLYLASFGPALEEFSRHWPLKRGTPRPEPLAKKRRKQAELFEEAFDPYAVTPEDALDAARREVKTWRLNQLTQTKGNTDLDPITSWFVLAWDAFKAPVFSYDEGLRLARAVGADLDQMIGKICEKKDSSNLKLWDSAARVAKGALGPADGSKSMLDAIHAAAYRGRKESVGGAFDTIKANGLDTDPQFLASLEAILEVLPPSKSFIGFDVATGDAKASADDFEALEKLRRLAFSDRVDQPHQLTLFVADGITPQ